jgi:hypothetical protein
MNRHIRTKHAKDISFLCCPVSNCGYKTPRADVLYRHINSEKHNKIEKSTPMSILANNNVGTTVYIDDATT